MVDLPIEIHEAGLLLVVRTLPGSAHAIAAALDRARWPEVAGSIAGLVQRLEQDALGSAEGANGLQATFADAVINGPA